MYNLIWSSNSAGVIKLRRLRWEISLDYSGELNVITTVSIRGGLCRDRAGGEVVREVEFGVVCFEGRGRPHKPKARTVTTLEAAKSRYMDSPLRACGQEAPVLDAP